MNNIEIGMEIIAKIYVHPLFDIEHAYAVDVSEITDIVDTIDGGMILFKEEGDMMLVEENGVMIREAMDEACSYKSAALKAVNDMLKT